MYKDQLYKILKTLKKVNNKNISFALHQRNV